MRLWASIRYDRLASRISLRIWSAFIRWLRWSVRLREQVFACDGMNSDQTRCREPSGHLGRLSPASSMAPVRELPTRPVAPASDLPGPSPSLRRIAPAPPAQNPTDPQHVLQVHDTSRFAARQRLRADLQPQPLPRFAAGEPG